MILHSPLGAGGGEGSVTALTAFFQVGALKHPGTASLQHAYISVVTLTFLLFFTSTHKFLICSNYIAGISISDPNVILQAYLNGFSVRSNVAVCYSMLPSYLYNLIHIQQCLY